jgi:AraC family transcriptional regulator of adaptative response/methylated-DNA-[protein]-cysteine methyltransferase
MHRAFSNRDAAYDGIFFTGVRTTGIFCRPSCPARKPLPGNVEFFATARDALFAGYRPCRRCRPLDVVGRPPEWVASIFERVDRDNGPRLRDEDLRAMGVDPVRLRRYFNRNFGMTFQAYCRARRLGSAFAEIRSGGSLDDAAHNSGYESYSGFRDAFGKLFGAPPGRSRGERCVLVRWLESPLGPLVAGATEEGVCLLEFTDRRQLEGQCREVRRRFGCEIAPGSNEHLDRLAAELNDYFAGSARGFSVPLVAPGTSFQKRVWQELLRIPYGRTISYEELARRVESPRAIRAVGTANGTNRIAIVIPCHRVVNKGGKLGGYGGGLWRKQFLLDLEQGQQQLGGET